MIRDYQIFDDCVQFQVWKEYPNHSRKHRYIQSKGSFYTCCKPLKRFLGWLWKRYGIGGRQ